MTPKTSARPWTPSTKPTLSNPITLTTTKTSTLFRGIALFVFIGLVYEISGNLYAMTSTDVDPPRHPDTVFIPFIYKFSSKHVPQVMCTIEGIDITMPVDTGSTGLLIGAPILSNISATIGTPAHHFFTSSKILYVGRLVELSIRFHGERSSYATSTVPVLIVDKSWRCPWYNPSTGGFKCPVGPNGENAVERDTSNITYMGVGFGRNDPKDGMPFAAPNVNPFLSIDAIDGRPVSTSSMRVGYVISAEGVQLGLTPHTTQGVVYQQLEPGLTHGIEPRDWAMAKMCFTVDHGGEHCGTVLVDTGIPQMYIRAGEGTSIPNITVPNPNPDGSAKTVKRVPPGTNIKVGFATMDTSSISYSFAVGEGSAVEPSFVVPQDSAFPPYVNTGRNFLFSYTIAFDAMAGRFGIRARSSSRPPSLL